MVAWSPCSTCAVLKSGRTGEYNIIAHAAYFSSLQGLIPYAIFIHRCHGRDGGVMKQLRPGGGVSMQGPSRSAVESPNQEKPAAAEVFHRRVVRPHRRQPL